MSEPSGTQQRISPDLSTEETVFSEKLRHVNCRESLTFNLDVETGEVLEKMRESRAGGVLITGRQSDRELAGIFTARDYLDKLASRRDYQGRPISEFMTPSPRTLSPDSTVGEAIQLMTTGGYRHVPLTNDDNTIFGLVSVRDIVNFVAEHFPEEVYNHPPLLHQEMKTQEGG